MPPAVRRAAPARAAAPTSGGSVNFGDDSFYLGGLGLPEGDYATTYHVQMFQPTKQNGAHVGNAFLAVMLTAYPIDKAGNIIGEGTEHPLGCGGKTHESFIPSADGKGFDSVAGGSGIGMNENCNWALYRKTLIDCGLPPGTLTNDLTVIDGTWVHTRNVPEPEERKAFRNKKTATGEAALAAQGNQANPEPERNRMCVTVVEILEGGKPWEGTGGLLDGGAAPAAPKAPARAAAPAPRAAAPAARGRVAAAPAPVAAAEEALTDEDIKVIALNGIGEVLTTKPTGCFKVALSTGTFAAVAATSGDDVAGAVIETYFQDNAVLDTLLGELGYRTNGAKVEPIPA